MHEYEKRYFIYCRITAYIKIIDILGQTQYPQISILFFNYLSAAGK